MVNSLLVLLNLICKLVGLQGLVRLFKFVDGWAQEVIFIISLWDLFLYLYYTILKGRIRRMMGELLSSLSCTHSHTGWPFSFREMGVSPFTVSSRRLPWKQRLTGNKSETCWGSAHLSTMHSSFVSPSLAQNTHFQTNVSTNHPV